MESVQRSIALTAFSLARFLDVYFYHIVICCALLIAYNLFVRKDWDSILFKAASEGNVGLMTSALQHSADVNFLAAGEYTPLIIACKNSREESVRLLLETTAGACKLDLFDVHGRTALHAAVQAGNDAIVRLLLDHGADVRAFDIDGNTPLIAAASAGRVEALKLLLGNDRVDIQWKNKESLNALIVAIHRHSIHRHSAIAASDRLSVISQLLDAKIDVEASNRNGWTAIISASYRGQTDVVELLVRHGAKVNAQSRRGFSALLAAAQNGWKDIVQLLLSNGAKSDLQTSDGSTALIAASAKGYDEVVRLLGQHDPSLVHRRFRAGCTALMTAVTKGFIGVVRELLLLGCDVDTANKDSWTALLLAAQRGFLGITRQLLQNKAVVDCYTSIGFTPLMYAIRNAYKDVVVELLDHGAMVNHFELDAFNKEVVTQKMPLVYGYITPLMLAVISGDRAMIELLLDRLADLHLDLSHLMVHCRGSSNGISSFHSREQLQGKSMNDATFVYSYCGTVLLLAIHQGDPSLVELLLQHEAEMKRRVESNGTALTAGLSPLSIARYKEQWVLDDRNSLGAGVLEVAAERGDPALFLLLLRRGAHFDRCSFSYWCVLGRFCCSLVYRCRLVHLARIFLALLSRCVRMPLRGVELSVGCKVKRD